MQNNAVSSGNFSFSVSDLITLGTIDFVLNVSASGLSGYQYSKDLNLKAKSSKNSNQVKVKLPDFKNCLILTNLKCIAFRA